MIIRGIETSVNTWTGSVSSEEKQEFEEMGMTTDGLNAIDNLQGEHLMWRAHSVWDPSFFESNEQKKKNEKNEGSDTILLSKPFDENNNQECMTISSEVVQFL